MENDITNISLKNYFKENSRYTAISKWSIIQVLLKVSEGLQLYYKRDPDTVVSCEVQEAFKNTFFHRTPSVAAFKISRYISQLFLSCLL